MNVGHGGDIYGKDNIILDFSVNTGPLGMPQKVRKAAVKGVEAGHLYPDSSYRALKQSLSQYYHLPTEYFMVGNGAADLIYSLVWATKPEKAMVLSPTFSEYQDALSAVGCKIVSHDLSLDKDFLVDEGLPLSLDSSLDLLFLCNPNNPTGAVISRSVMEHVLTTCERLSIGLVVDECFMDFVEEEVGYSLTEYTRRYSCLLVLKAFTKTYAMAGLRLGFCICGNETWLKAVEVVRQPWSVSSVAQNAGIAALSLEGFVEETRRIVKEERAFLSTGLESMECRVFPSDANFILFRALWCGELKERLLEQGILIRSCDNFPGLTGNDYRIAVKKREENQVLLDRIRKEWEKIWPR